jgi:hypothetical protein
LAKKGIPVVPQHPYSPDMSTCDFFLFPKLKVYLKGRHFGMVENKKSCNQPTESDFQRCYEEWEHLQWCVAYQGDYFEGDVNL